MLYVTAEKALGDNIKITIRVMGEVCDDDVRVGAGGAKWVRRGSVACARGRVLDDEGLKFFSVIGERRSSMRAGVALLLLCRLLRAVCARLGLALSILSGL